MSGNRVCVYRDLVLNSHRAGLVIQQGNCPCPVALGYLEDAAMHGKDCTLSVGREGFVDGHCCSGRQSVLPRSIRRTYAFQ